MTNRFFGVSAKSLLCAIAAFFFIQLWAKVGETMTHVVVSLVALTDVRKEGLRNRAQKVKHNALFTTLLASSMNPHGGVWLDYEGQITSVDKPVAKHEEKYCA